MGAVVEYVPDKVFDAKLLLWHLSDLNPIIIVVDSLWLEIAGSLTAVRGKSVAGGLAGWLLSLPHLSGLWALGFWAGLWASRV